MGIFDFLKKKKETELPLPPPPGSPDMTFTGDIESIRAPQETESTQSYTPREENADELLELPELPPALPAPSQFNRPLPKLEEKEEAPKKDIIYDRTISPQEERPTIQPLGPTFVAVDDYRRIITDTNTVRAKLMNAENFARRLGDIKNTEERAFEKWRGYLEDVEKKMNYVDQLIAKAQR